MEYKTSKIFNISFTHFEYEYSNFANFNKPTHSILFYMGKSNPIIKETTPKTVVDFYIEQDNENFPNNDEIRPFIKPLIKKHSKVYNIDYVDFDYNIIETMPVCYEIVFQIDRKNKKYIDTTRQELISFYNEINMGVPNNILDL